ncbi:NAD(P)-binding protein [Dendrothele bispora CBS 962.96]|uniref:NAD(P)-binding protein n=1 Tax=Dendrothele bispora (strain CBS 962.96) TaxID=1314807 RepID=A0A4S8L220_DENBC|nr:NAD(P)-binding protein [Dendrothele bispora CBS 962.96]
MSSKQQLVWLITGTTSGFGQRLVAAALARGDRVIATARSFEKLQEVYSSTPSDNLRLLQLDIVSGLESIKQAIDIAAKFWDRIDVLVNNAGNGYLGLIEESGSKMIRQQFETNVFGTIDVTNAVLPYMRARKQGTVVVIGSRSIWRADTPGLGTYAASKAAIHALTEALSKELAPINIRVLLVAPGAFRTEGIYGIPFNTSNPISDYDDLRNMANSRYLQIPGNEPGDPVKAMEVLVDVVRGEGCAKGKKWPTVLPLGQDAEADMRGKWDAFMNVLEEWGNIVRSVCFPG